MQQTLDNNHVTSTHM